MDVVVWISADQPAPLCLSTQWDEERVVAELSEWLKDGMGLPAEQGSAFLLAEWLGGFDATVRVGSAQGPRCVVVDFPARLVSVTRNHPLRVEKSWTFKKLARMEASA